MTLRSGDLDRLIKIEVATEARTAVGEVTATWSLFATTWAAVEPLTERELLQASQTYAERTTRFRTRHVPGVQPKMRVNWNGRLFDIHAVRSVGIRDEGLELLAVETETA